MHRKETSAANAPTKLFLPGFDIGAMPNHLNRSSFIAPIARGRRKFHRQEIMVSRRDCVLQYTGEQLDEADGDILMALIFFAGFHPLGEAVSLNRAQLLQKIERNLGNAQYKWLHRRLKALTEGTLFLEAKKRDGSTKYKIGWSAAFHIVSSFTYDEIEKEYKYVLDPRWVEMFGNREYALIDWKKRMMLRRGQDMAKTLQRLIATSSDPLQHYALDWLKAKMDYSGRLRDFRDAIQCAVMELERVEIIAHGKIELSTKRKEQLSLWIEFNVA
ncbi:hypothetical protein H8K32_13910 [Undibacterium jejuense]|uniref:Plasmid-related transcriptional repressor protein n=2 Tax=Undibacterium jejuense TaxID=1344949 RepID=A0A923HHP3_9BURK|nr:hypothetical protein [Undibacterium jejuense]